MVDKLAFRGVSFRYGKNVVLDGVTLGIPQGDMVALIGANGAGKSTLLGVASGTLRPDHGHVELDGRSVHSFPALQRAMRIALVPQALTIPFAFTVRELVGLGRTPYIGFLGNESDRDRHAVEAVLEVTDTHRFSNRSVLDLSAGERQRVLLALALAQEPDLLLLDEPTANLDIAHQLSILELLRDLNRERALTVLAAVHDLNLAGLCFDRILALDSGHIVADGTPQDVLTSAVVRRVYGTDVRIVNHPVDPVPLIALVRGRPQ